MADRYIDEAYIHARLGSEYERAATTTQGIDRDALIEDATADVQAAMRNSGYSPPSTQDPTEVEEYVKMATLGRYREMLATVPEAAISLPENWADHPHRLAWERIVSGESSLAAEPSQTQGVGGMIFTTSDPDVTGSKPKRATRTNLAGL